MVSNGMRHVAGLLTLIIALAAAAYTPLEASKAATGNVLQVESVIGAPNATVYVPLSLKRTAGTTQAPVAVEARLCFDPDVLAPKLDPEAGAPVILTTASPLLELWYDKSVQASSVNPGEVRVLIFGFNLHEITTYDDQRSGGDPNAQSNPFPLGSILFRVTGEAGTSSSLALLDIVMVDDEPNELTQVGFENGTFTVVSPGVDSDGDGLSDEDETALYGTHPNNPDTDGDQMPDGWEVAHDLNPLLDDADGDPDGDGISNIEELRLGSDPSNPEDPGAQRYVDALSGSDALGDGSLTSPWGSIQHALSGVSAFAAALHPVTVHVGPGVYSGPVALPPYVSVKGVDAVETVIALDAKASEHVAVVEGAENAQFSFCTLTSNLPGVTLLQINGVSMRVENVVLDGDQVADTVGIYVKGTGSSDTVVSNCVIRGVDDGIWAEDSAATVTRTCFEDIAYAGVVVVQPDASEGSAPLTPLLGDVHDPLNTGFNRFRMGGEAFVHNATAATVLAELNDWGVYSSEAIEAALSGPVDYSPYIMKATGFDSVFAFILDDESGDPVAQMDNPTARIPSLGLTATLVSPSTGLYSFDTVPAGDWTMTGEADGYDPDNELVHVSEESGAEIVTFNLVPDEGAPGLCGSRGEAAYACVGLVLWVAHRRRRYACPKPLAGE
jgi:hypothetical protein